MLNKISESESESINYQSFFPKFISAWNGLAQEIAVAKTLDLFKI